MVDSNFSVSFIDIDNPAFINGEYDYLTELSYKAKSPISRGIFWSLCGMRKLYNYSETVQMDLTTILCEDTSASFAYFAIVSCTISDSITSLLNAIFMDYNIYDYLFENPYVNSWTKKVNDYLVWSASKNSFRDQIYIDRSIKKSYEDSYTTAIIYSVFSYVPLESFTLCVQYVMHIIAFMLFVLLFVSYVTNSYDQWNKNEKTIDQDFFINSLTVESEEEIASIEDMALGLIMLTMIFGVFFLSNSIVLISILPETTFMFYLLPLFFMIIYIMPALLIYDFGIFFLSIFRGSSNSASLAMELLYDYIALASAYLRLIVQNVRLLLMILVYASLHEAVITYVAYASLNPFYESFWDWKDSFWSNFSENPFFFLIKIPSNIIYWIYELLHTFFVIIVQFVAFFAMVFWIYLFLYTMFFLKTQENFFTEKKEKRKKHLKDLGFYDIIRRRKK